MRYWEGIYNIPCDIHPTKPKPLATRMYPEGEATCFMCDECGEGIEGEELVMQEIAVRLAQVIV